MSGPEPGGEFDGFSRFPEGLSLAVIDQAPDLYTTLLYRAASGEVGQAWMFKMRNHLGSIRTQGVESEKFGKACGDFLSESCGDDSLTPMQRASLVLYFCTVSTILTDAVASQYHNNRIADCQGFKITAHVLTHLFDSTDYLPLEMKPSDSVINWLSRGLVEYARGCITKPPPIKTEFDEIYESIKLMLSVCPELPTLATISTSGDFHDVADGVDEEMFRLLKSDDLAELVVGGALLGAVTSLNDELPRKFLDRLPSMIQELPPVPMARMISACVSGILLRDHLEQDYFDEQYDDEGITVRELDETDLASDFKKLVLKSVDKLDDQPSSHGTLKRFLARAALHSLADGEKEKELTAYTQPLRDLEESISLLHEVLGVDGSLIPDAFCRYGILKTMLEGLEEVRTPEVKRLIVESLTRALSQARGYLPGLVEQLSKVMNDNSDRQELQGTLQKVYVDAFFGANEVRRKLLATEGLAKLSTHIDHALMSIELLGISQAKQALRMVSQDLTLVGMFPVDVATRPAFLSFKGTLRDNLEDLSRILHDHAGTEGSDPLMVGLCEELSQLQGLLGQIEQDATTQT